MTYARTRVGRLGDQVDVGCWRCGWQASTYFTAPRAIAEMQRLHRCPPWPYARHAALVIGRGLADLGERLRRWGAWS